MGRLPPLPPFSSGTPRFGGAFFRAGKNHVTYMVCQSGLAPENFTTLPHFLSLGSDKGAELGRYERRHRRTAGFLKLALHRWTCQPRIDLAIERKPSRPRARPFNNVRLSRVLGVCSRPLWHWQVGLKRRATHFAVSWSLIRAARWKPCIFGSVTAKRHEPGSTTVYARPECPNRRRQAPFTATRRSTRSCDSASP